MILFLSEFFNTKDGKQLIFKLVFLFFIKLGTKIHNAIFFLFFFLTLLYIFIAFYYSDMEN